MIVQPDFLIHWKTDRLRELTGDESSPLAVLYLWAHCQHNRRWKFPDMTPAQLASICKWGKRTPACHVALVKAGFVDKLSPRGFAAHQWDEHNAQLIQKWHAGKKGGRPPKDETARKTGDAGKPTDNRPTTGTKPDKTRLDQTRPEEMSPVQSSPEAFQDSARVATVDAGTGLDSSASPLGGTGNGLDGLDAAAKAIAASKRATPRLTVEQAVIEIRCRKPHLAERAEEIAVAWHAAMERDGWKDRTGQPIQKPTANLLKYADACDRNARGVRTKVKGSKPNNGF